MRIPRRPKVPFTTIRMPRWAADDLRLAQKLFASARDAGVLPPFLVEYLRTQRECGNITEERSFGATVGMLYLLARHTLFPVKIASPPKRYVILDGKRIPIP